MTMTLQLGHTRVTIEKDNERYIFVGPYCHLDDYEDLFKKMLCCVGFVPETINLLFPVDKDILRCYLTITGVLYFKSKKKERENIKCQS